MNIKDFYESKIRAIKQWLFLLTYYPEDDLGLPKGVSKQEAIDKALEELKFYRALINLLDDES